MTNIEKRRKPRIYIPFPARVKGVDRDGVAFAVDSVLDNLSGNGLYVRIMPCVTPQAPIHVAFKLSLDGDGDRQPAWVEVEGTVVRADEHPGTVCGVAVTFEQPQFL